MMLDFTFFFWYPYIGGVSKKSKKNVFVLYNRNEQTMDQFCNKFLPWSNKTVDACL